MRQAVWLVAAALAASVPVHAKVLVREPVYDFGTVEQGVRLARGFVIENKGKIPVRIERTVSSCGCTVAASEGQVIGPRSRTVMNVTLDTAGLVGRTSKTVTVRTSDPQTPAVQVALRGSVLADLMVVPETVYLGQVWRGEPVRRELVIGPGRPKGKPYTATSVETESPVVWAYLQPGPKPGQQKVVIELGYDVPEGRFNDEVVIRTTSPRQPVIKVPVFGQILG